jgi:hypothetical protein
MTRPDGSHYQVGRAQDRGDRCYAAREPGWYWHDLDEQWGIVESSVSGPYANDVVAALGGMMRGKPEDRYSL